MRTNDDEDSVETAYGFVKNKFIMKKGGEWWGMGMRRTRKEMVFTFTDAADEDGVDR